MSEYGYYIHTPKNRLKELRERNNLTLKELGKKLNMRDNTLSQYENGKRTPKVEVWEKIANYFDVSVNYLLGYSNEEWDAFSFIEKQLNKAIFSDDISENNKIKETLIDCFGSINDKIESLQTEIDTLKNQYEDQN